MFMLLSTVTCVMHIFEFYNFFGFLDEEHNSKCLWSPKGISEQKCKSYVILNTVENHILKNLSSIVDELMNIYSKDAYT